MNRLRLSAAALALIAAFAFASQTKGDPEVFQAVTALQDTTFTTLPESEGGPLEEPEEGTRAEIESVCPSSGQDCASATDPLDPSNVIEWGGAADKF